MASPQIENGYTKLANELLEALARFNFSARQYSIILAVIRKTYGWIDPATGNQKKLDRISITQLCDLTGISRGNVSNAVNELIAMRVFLKREHRGVYLIGIQKNYSKWKKAKNKLSTGKRPGCSQNGNRVFPNQEQKCSQNGNIGVPESGTTITKKENNKKGNNEFHSEQKQSSAVDEKAPPGENQEPSIKNQIARDACELAKKILKGEIVQ